jgi:hypothetical protein
MPITHSLWTVTQEHPTIVAIAGDGWSPHPRAPDRNLVLSAVCLFCSVNDAVNVLPCSTWAYLNGRLS